MRVNSYDLFLDADFRALRYDGRVVIELESEQDVTLNSLALEILRISSNGKPLSYKQDGENLTLGTGPFSGRVEIEYCGSISEQLVGLYKAPYDGDYMISSHFEAAHARMMFPCVDHPNYKAEFKLTVRADEDLVIISNMPAESISQEGSKRTTVFQKTPRMSTYLLYLGVGKLDEEKAEQGALVVSATVPGKVSKTKFAAQVAVYSVKYYESYYGIPYQLPKLHLVAVPEFAAGAMENWGAITFREIFMLVDQNTRVRTKKRVAYVVAHEVAHQWFGDLVTMKWWDDIWLNETFATFMATKTVDSEFPEWNAWQDFLRLETSGALDRDSLRSTHPIATPVKQPSEIEQIFDEITYGKGASILRMLEAYVGPDSFRKGVRSYLEEYKYANATGNDLWSHIEAAAGGEVKRVMREWIGRPGYPVVSVSAQGRKLILKQERFMQLKPLPKVQDQSVWPIPLTMKINGERKTLLMDSEAADLELPHDLSSLKLNIDQTGFYRVLYDGLYEKVWKSDLTALDRFGIISDAFAFTVAGKMPFRIYQEIVARYFKEEEYLPAYEVSNQLAFLYSITPAVEEICNSFHTSQLEILRRKTDENSVALRGAVADRLVMVSSEYAGDLARSFRDYEGLEPDMRQAVASAYARTTADFEGLASRYRVSATDEERYILLNALMSFREPQLIGQALQLARSGEVKKQDVWAPLYFSARNPSARDTVRAWIIENLTWLRKLFEGTPTVSFLFKDQTPFLWIGKVQEAANFFAENKMPEADQGVEAGLEKLRIYDEFLRRIGEKYP